MKKIFFIILFGLSNFIAGGEQNLIPSTNTVSNSSHAKKITEHLNSIALHKGHEKFQQQCIKNFRLECDFFKKIQKENLSEQDKERLKTLTKNISEKNTEFLRQWSNEQEKSLKRDRCLSCGGVGLGLGCLLCGLCISILPPPSTVPLFFLQSSSMGISGILGIFTSLMAIDTNENKTQQLCEIKKIQDDLKNLEIFKNTKN